MDDDRLTSIVEFLQSAEALKDTLRSGHTGHGRAESVAEHSWRLTLLVLLLRDEMQGIDVLHLIELCIIHDLGEAIGGDVPAPLQFNDPNRAEREHADFRTLCEGLPVDLRDRLVSLHREYERGETPEAVMAKGLDKIETILQHVKGANAADFDHGFNLHYGQDRTEKTFLLRALRSIVDDRTRASIEAQKEGAP